MASVHLCSIFSFSLITPLALFGGLVIFFVPQKLMKTPLTHTPAMFKLHTRKSVSVLVAAYLPFRTAAWAREGRPFFLLEAQMMGSCQENC